MCLVFPIIDAILFSETIKVAYCQPQASYYGGNASARACIYAFLAFASVLNLRGKTLPAVDSEGCALKAQCLLLQVMQETATVDGLQTVIMLVSVTIMQNYLSILYALICTGVYIDIGRRCINCSLEIYELHPI